MSLSSSFYAEYANKIKAEWEKDLRTALKDKDWGKVQALLNKISKFYFSE